ncbi:MAG TPA: DUF411 domain-containing protein [Mariprofundaceae bacterium]|nr:DUF411 domain-containing protein [Mariprofundaceae bacterium]
MTDASRKPLHLMPLLLAGLALVAFNASNGAAENAATSARTTKEIVMYKSPGCECCTGWAEHMRKAGFTVTENKRDDMDAIKSKYGVTDKLASCHTAIIDGYVIEGHVPAADVERLLNERPQVVGLTAPGMPQQSPGMQDKANHPKGYDVLAFDKEAKSHVFTRY